MKQKYWYRTTICCCVLCWKETRYKERVYTIEEKGMVWNDDACNSCWYGK